MSWSKNMEEKVFSQKCAKVVAVLRNASCILVAGHGNPDGDSLGSVLGFAEALRENFGKEVIRYSIDPVPSAFRALSGAESITREIEWYPDVIVGFDYGDIRRLGIPEEFLRAAQIITFDHHPPGRQEGDVAIIDTSVASTTELLYHFMREVDWSISKDVAQCLLTGIITDTGAFSHNTKERTFQVAGDLVARGAVLSRVYESAFGGKSAQVLNAWGSLIAGAYKDPGTNAMFLFVPFAEFKSYGIVLEDLAGIVSVLNRAAEADFSVFALEYEPDHIKVSFRGEEFKGVPVAPIAEVLGGGGHAYAAGCTLDMPFEEAQTRIKEAVERSVGVAV
jgi:phosphoesterase RecJ-like protein